MDTVVDCAIVLITVSIVSPLIYDLIQERIEQNRKSMRDLIRQRESVRLALALKHCSIFDD
jgi:hypothetical protein